MRWPSSSTTDITPLTSARRRASITLDAIICDALKAVGSELTVSPPDGGMQVVARLGPLRDDREICRRLAEAGVTARPLSPHYCAQTGAQGLFLGFAAWNECEIDAGVRILARVIREPEPSK